MCGGCFLKGTQSDKMGEGLRPSRAGDQRPSLQRLEGRDHPQFAFDGFYQTVQSFGFIGFSEFVP